MRPASIGFGDVRSIGVVALLAVVLTGGELGAIARPRFRSERAAPEHAAAQGSAVEDGAARTRAPMAEPSSSQAAGVAIDPETWTRAIAILDGLAETGELNRLDTDEIVPRIVDEDLRSAGGHGEAVGGPGDAGALRAALVAEIRARRVEVLRGTQFEGRIDLETGIGRTPERPIRVRPLRPDGGQTPPIAKHEPEGVETWAYAKDASGPRSGFDPLPLFDSITTYSYENDFVFRSGTTSPTRAAADMLDIVTLAGQCPTPPEGIVSIEYIFNVFGAQPNGQRRRVMVWNTWNQTAPAGTSVVSNNLLTVNDDFGPLPVGLFYTEIITLASPVFPTHADNIGVEFKFTDNVTGALTSTLTWFAIGPPIGPFDAGPGATPSGHGPPTGSSGNFFYRDQNADGVLSSNEALMFSTQPQSANPTWANINLHLGGRPPATEIEPNNTSATANALCLCDQRTATAESVDHYKFHLDAAGAMQVLVSQCSTGSVTLVLRNSMATIIGGPVFGCPSQITTGSLSPGDYFIEVDGSGAAYTVQTKPLAGQVTGLRFATGPSGCSKDHIVWDPQANSLYDAVRGDLQMLRSQGGDFSHPAVITDCWDVNLSIPETTDPSIPATGQGLFYLARAKNSCGGVGSYDEGGNQIGSRDAEINSNPNTSSCPFAPRPRFSTDGTSCGSLPSGGNSGFEPPSESGAPPNIQNEPTGQNAGSVYLHSGEYHLEATDLRIAGRGFDFDWGRKYRSREGRLTAMGNNWDFTYNASVAISGDNPADRWVYDGNSRRDTYRPSTAGCWTAEGFFRDLCVQPGGSYTLTFADKRVWTFAPLDGSPAAGKMIEIRDRNQNTMTLSYDAGGRLATIVDTLGRTMNVVTNADGYISEVRADFVGRSVRYTYYQDQDVGGGAGDLKSVTSPFVMGTPNGNDFPAGKTTVYTYSENFAAAGRNHNLLTITDPRGTTFLQNAYSAATSPFDPSFDRVTSQTFPNGVISYVYLAQVPSAGNSFATVRTVVNDRAGNVKEVFFNARNQLVVLKEFTGRAPDPAGPTSDVLNRPANKLRAGDPAVFETRYEYDADSLVTRVVRPAGNSVEYSYESTVSPGGPRRSQGNLRQIRRLPGAIPSDQPQIVDSFEYQSGFGGREFVTRHVDGRGNQTLHTYDGVGNRLHTQHRIPSIVEDYEYNAFGQMTAHILPDNGSGHRRRDETTYFASGDPRGYRQSEIVDAGGLALTTTFQVDRVGNVTCTIDPRGNDEIFSVNQLDQVVRRSSRKSAGGSGPPCQEPMGSGLRYHSDTFYDADDNLVRLEVDNLDENGTPRANATVSTVLDHDALNRPIGWTSETGPSDSIETGMSYDANDDPDLALGGEATNGNQPFNVARTSHDERNLPFRDVRAEGDPAQSADQADYDANGNETVVREGLGRCSGGTGRCSANATNAGASCVLPGPGSCTGPGAACVAESCSTNAECPGGGSCASAPGDQPRVTTTVYDGYNRRVRETDPMGNVTTYHYDANGNMTSMRVDGQLNDVPGGVGNVRLSETTWQYDAMDRRTREDVAFFDVTTGTPIGDGFATTITGYSGTSQVTSVQDDNGRVTATSYDGANRTLVVTDARGNTIAYGRDANGNVTSTTSVELSDLGGPAETFVTLSTYDALDRLVTTVDPVGNTTLDAYDSRGNRVRMLDSLGREERRSFDDQDRPVGIVRDMDGDGSTTTADVETHVAWDDESRSVALTDDKGNVTAPSHDPIGRESSTNMADCTDPGRTYDVRDNVKTETDANGTVVTYAYDLLDRVIGKTIAPGPGVAVDTTFESYQYDGVSRLVFAQDNDSTVTRQYDSLSHVTREVQALAGAPSRTVSAAHDGVGNAVQVVYPGGRTVARTFDPLDRLKIVSDGGGTIAQLDYVGPDRVRRRTLGNGTRTDYLYDGIPPNPPGDAGVKRVVRTTHALTGTGAILDDRTTRWDGAGNVTQRKDMRGSGPRLTHGYVLDRSDRLVRTTVLDAASAVVRDTFYSLDGAGNRLSVAGPGTPDAGYYSEAMTCPVADFEMNQYTTTPMGPRSYDDKGNLVSAGGAATVRYDYLDRMVEYTDLATGRRHTYAYDALGRRILKTVDADGAAGGPFATRFLLHGSKEIEEQSLAGGTLATYVAGDNLDDLLTMRRGGADYWFHADDHRDVRAVTDAAGSVLERYEYEDYGQPSFLPAILEELPRRAGPPPGSPNPPESPSGTAESPRTTSRRVGPLSDSPDVMTGSPGAPSGDAGGPSAGRGAPSGSSIDNPFLYTGRRYDPESGLYHFRRRYLDPRAGRFTTRDPLGAWGDPANAGNALTYAGDNPVRNLDPTGLAPEEFDLEKDYKIDDVIDALDSEAFVTRMSAEKWLKAKGREKGKTKEVLDPIEKRLKGKLATLEMRRRLERIVEDVKRLDAGVVKDAETLMKLAVDSSRKVGKDAFEKNPRDPKKEKEIAEAMKKLEDLAQKTVDRVGPGPWRAEELILALKREAKTVAKDDQPAAKYVIWLVETKWEAYRTRIEKLEREKLKKMGGG